MEVSGPRWAEFVQREVLAGRAGEVWRVQGFPSATTVPELWPRRFQRQEKLFLAVEAERARTR